jgi:hypothetical protein
MGSRRGVWVCVGLVACGCVAHFGTPLLAQKNEGDPAAPEAKQDAERALALRYAKAHLRVMETTLARYEEMNRISPNTIRPGVIQAIQQNVADARQRVQQAENGKDLDSTIYVSRAEARLQLTEDVVRKAEASRARFAGAVSQPEMDRLQAELELARVRLDKARHLASESPLSNVRYELDQLREDIQELRIFVALLRSRN